VALVCGLFVMIALAVAAYFAYKTRSKIWHHGKPNIYWEEPPILKTDRSHNSQDWVSKIHKTHSVNKYSNLWTVFASIIYSQFKVEHFII